MVAPESMIQKPTQVVFKTFNPTENGDLPGYADEQVPKGLSMLSIKDLTLSTSSWLRLPDSFDKAISITSDIFHKSQITDYQVQSLTELQSCFDTKGFLIYAKLL